MTSHFRKVAAPVAAIDEMLPDIDSRFLLEGIQAYGSRYLIWVLIQTGPESKSGELCFYDTSGHGPNYRVRLPGRPGFVRPLVARPGMFIVGMDRILATVSVTPERASAPVVTTLAEIPESIVPRSKIWTMGNDGIVDPTGLRIVWGLKDFHFGARSSAGVLVQYADGAFRVIRDGEICPNGNAFVNIRGKKHLLHVETHSQTVYGIPYSVRTGETGEARPLFSFAESANFPAEVYREHLMPDGLVHWKNGVRDKIIFCIYDPNPKSEEGQALQFDVTNGVFTFEGVYVLPGSPRVTCATVHRPLHTDEATVYFTTADEGLLASCGQTREDRPRVGSVFRCDGGEIGNDPPLSFPTEFHLVS